MESLGFRIKWWGISGIEIHLQGVNFCFDPYLYPKQPKINYIFITHEHYDHFHEPTLKKLCSGPQFKFLVVPQTCFYASSLLSPVSTDYELTDLNWIQKDKVMMLRPKIIAPGKAMLPKELEQNQIFVERFSQATTTGSAFDGPLEVMLGQLKVEGVATGENPVRLKDGTSLTEPMSNLGYLITDTVSKISFYHPGDIHQSFPELRKIRSQVDYMFLPINKLGGISDDADFINLIQPKHVIPIHYRLDDDDWPVPLNVSPADIIAADWETGEQLPNTDWDDYWADVQKLISGHWYPSPTNPLQYIHELKQIVKDKCDIICMKPGNDYNLFK
jgi:L-ascorbate metabolism protein UlaG (beta-lactamase superfamily)